MHGLYNTLPLAPPSLNLFSSLTQGRVVSNIKSTGLSSMNPQTIALSVDTVAIRERKDEKSQYCHTILAYYLSCLLF